MKRAVTIVLMVLLAIALSGCEEKNVKDIVNRVQEVNVEEIVKNVQKEVKKVPEKITGETDKLRLFWACMDGCLIMQKLHEKKYGINATKEDHDLCADICWKLYVENSEVK